MLAARNAFRSSAVMLALFVSACGYSQEEWDQKVRENESLRDPTHDAAPSAQKVRG